MLIYKPKGKAGEYSPLALNFIKGCTHRCAYCYANDVDNVIELPSESDLLRLEDSAKQYKGCGLPILLSFTTDIYCDYPASIRRRVLNILNKYNHSVTILSKGGLKVLEDLDIFEKFRSFDLFGDADRITFGFTLTFDNDEQTKLYESGAAPASERVTVIKKLKELGYKIWISFEPVIVPEQTLRLIEEVADYVDYVKIGKLNHNKHIEDTIDWNKFLIDAVTLCRSKKLRFYIKDDLRKFKGDFELSPEETNPNLYY